MCLLCHCTIFLNVTLMAELLPAQVDNRHAKDPILTPEQAAKICDRNFGIGGDGVSVGCIIEATRGRA